MKGRSLLAVTLALVMVFPVGMTVPTEPEIPSPQVPVSPARLMSKLGLPPLDLVPEVVNLEDVLSQPDSGPGTTRYLAPDEEETHINAVYDVNGNTTIAGTLNLVDTEVIFHGPYTLTIASTGVVTITGASSIHDADSNRFTRGIIRSEGSLTIDGTGSPISINSVFINIVSGPTSLIRQVRVSDAVNGITTASSNTVIELSTFNSLDRAVVTAAGNPKVHNNTFVDNTIAVFVSAGGAVRTPHIHNNEFKANQIGVRCAGAGGTPPPASNNPAEIHGNNFRNHFADAYAGFRPLAGFSSSSVCRLNNNFFATGESRHDGTLDSITNNRASPEANSAPVSPITAQVITNAQTLNNPVLAGPLIVDDGGSLTITGTLNANGHLWGSGTGGILTANGIGIVNNGQLTIRNTNDGVDDLSFTGPASRIILFGIGGPTLHALQYRNNATIEDWTARDIHSLIQLTGGSHADDVTWSGALTRFDTDRTAESISFGNLVTVDVTDGVFRNAAVPAGRAKPTSITAVLHNQIADITVTDSTLENFNDFGLHTGVFAILGNINVENNIFRNGAIGTLSGQATLTATNNDYIAMAFLGLANLPVVSGGSVVASDNVYDGGYIGAISILGTGMTMTGEVFAGQNYGVQSVADTTATITGSTFAYNAYAVVASADTVSVTNGNFRDNYQYSLYGMPQDPVGTGVVVPTNINCNNCFFYRNDDKAYSNGNLGAITVTEAAIANPNPDPPWLGQVTIAGPGQTVSLSGTLNAPAIAREGGRLKVESTTLNGQDRFPIGGKTGGNSAGATGHLTLTGSTFNDVRFISVNSTNSVIEGNIFRSTTELIELTTRGMTIECNQFEGIGVAVDFQRQKLTGEPDLVFRRNLITDVTSGNALALGGGSGVALGYLWAELDEQRATVEKNGAVRGSLLTRYDEGATTLRDNNMLGKIGLWDVGWHPDHAPVPIDAEGNWWGDASGPLVVNQDGDVLENAGALGAWIVIRDNGVNPNPIPDYTPWDTEANAIPLCMAFSFSPATPTEIELVTFDDNSFAPSGSPIVSRTWNFGDGSGDISGGEIITHDFLDGGTRTVTLTVTTALGETGTLSRDVVVSHVAPIAAFTQAIVDEITPVDFTDTSTHPNTPQDDPPTGWTYDWDFGDSTSSALRNPSHRYADGGTYTVELTATDNDAQSDSLSRSITVPHVPPVASFTVTGTQETDTYQFTDTSTHPNAPTDSIVTRAWSCTDGFTSSATNPTHRFADGGSYSCTLTVTDNDSQSSSVTNPVSVAHVAPNADFSAPTVNELQDTVFTDTSTHPNSPTDDPPAGWTYAWVLGDGATSSARNPTHRYADGGTYTVDLTVTDNDGLTDSVTRTVTVTHVAPVAGFTHSPSLPQPGDTVQFTDTSTHPHAPTDGIVSWSWVFGDGGTSTLQNPSHVFSTAGLYDVTLTVTDDDAQSASVTRQVSVGAAPPIAAFHTDPADPTSLDNIHFLDDSTDPDGVVVAWAWQFGDGGTSTLQNPFHQYADSGTYAVTLTVTDDDGLTGTITRDLVVRNVPPVANFTFSPALPVAGFPTSFQDLSSDPDGRVVAWAWSFGDGGTSTLQNPSHTYATGGNYLVTLTVTDNHGATASVAKLIHVCQPPGGIVIGPGISLNIELCVS